MTGPLRVLRPDVVIVGGGPAGLSAAALLGRALGDHVLVLDREMDAGGIPRHSDHSGYGLRDLRRLMTGPAYARRLVDAAVTAGADIRTEAMVTGWAGPRTLEVTTPGGRLLVEAQVVVLATGARERPQSARRVPGDRASGVYTTGYLQNQVHLHGGHVGRRAVIVGAELVSWSAVLTLREAGCAVVLMASEHPKPESYGALNRTGRSLLGIPLATRTRVVRVIGRPRVHAVELEQLDTGQRRTVACDTVVFTGDWIPDNELARTGRLDLDAGSLGPIIDTAFRTSATGVFAAGNLVHPVDTADVAALDGRHVAGQVMSYLADPREVSDGVRLTVDPPLLWVSPGRVRPDAPSPPRRRLLCWSSELVARPRITVRQDGRVIDERRLWWPAAPGRVFRIPSSILDGINATGADVRISIAG